MSLVTTTWTIVTCPFGTKISHTHFGSSLTCTCSCVVKPTVLPPSADSLLVPTTEGRIQTRQGCRVRLTCSAVAQSLEWRKFGQHVPLENSDNREVIVSSLHVRMWILSWVRWCCDKCCKVARRSVQRPYVNCNSILCWSLHFRACTCSTCRIPQLFQVIEVTCISM